MKWTECAIQDLRKYAGLKASVENIAERIEALEIKFTGVKGNKTYAEPISGSGGTHWEESMLDNIVERERLKLLLVINKKMVAIIERGLSTLSGKERLVLDKFFINRHYGYIDELIEELRFERAHVYRLKDEAIRKFTINMYGIEEY